MDYERAYRGQAGYFGLEPSPMLLEHLPAIAPGGGPAPIAILPEGLAARDAVSALTNLGYAHGEAAAAVSSALGVAGNEAKAEELIRIGLKELAG